VVDFAIDRLNHFAHRCRDAEETRHFYEDLLGLPLAHIVQSNHVPSTGEYCPYMHVFFKMRDGSFVAFFDLGDDEAPLPSPNTPSWVNHIALQVPDEQHLLAAKARLENAGVEVLGVTDHKIIHSIYFFDPNGLRVELTTWAVDQAYMEREALVARSRLDAWTRQKRQRRLDSGLGHAAAPVAEKNESSTA
jgi:catechol 2,3-dioxygenase-like lactoylglutathione lyase family enzyme